MTVMTPSARFSVTLKTYKLVLTHGHVKYVRPSSAALDAQAKLGTGAQ